MGMPRALKRAAFAIPLLFGACNVARAGNAVTCHLQPSSENCVQGRLLERAIEDEAYDGYEVFRLHIGHESYEFRRGREGRVVLDARAQKDTLRTFFYPLNEGAWQDVAQGWKQFRLDVATTYKDRFTEDARDRPEGTFGISICTHDVPVDFEVALAGEGVIRMSPVTCGKDEQTESKVRKFVARIMTVIARSVPFCSPFAPSRVNTCFLLEGDKLLAASAANNYLDFIDACTEDDTRKLAEYSAEASRVTIEQSSANERHGPLAAFEAICRNYGYFDTELIEGRSDRSVVIIGSAGSSFEGASKDVGKKGRRFGFTQYWLMDSGGKYRLEKWDVGTH